MIYRDSSCDPMWDDLDLESQPVAEWAEVVEDATLDAIADGCFGDVAIDDVEAITAAALEVFHSLVVSADEFDRAVGWGAA